MNFFLWLIIGGLAGWIAGKLMGSEGGLARNIIVGIVGSYVGGFLFAALGFSSVRKFSVGGLIVAVVGACLFIWVARAVTKHR